MIVEEFIHVVFGESNSKLQDQMSINADVIQEKQIEAEAEPSCSNEPTTETPI